MSFADIPNNGLPPDDFTAFKNVSFDTPAFRKIYKIFKPFKDICQVCESNKFKRSYLYIE